MYFIIISALLCVAAAEVKKVQIVVKTHPSFCESLNETEFGHLRSHTLSILLNGDRDYNIVALFKLKGRRSSIRLYDNAGVSSLTLEFHDKAPKNLWQNSEWDRRSTDIVETGLGMLTDTHNLTISTNGTSYPFGVNFQVDGKDLVEVEDIQRDDETLGNQIVYNTVTSKGMVFKNICMYEA